MNLRLITLLIALGLLALTACNPKQRGAPQSRPGQPTQLPKSLQFKKVTVGLPSEYIGVVGRDDYGIAGAADANKIFYAVKGKENYELHSTDLATMQSKKITDHLSDMYSRSLTTDPAGERLVYTKLRTVGSYVDNPAITEPLQVAVISSYDVAARKESDVFDFRQGDWLRYRSTSLAPMLSRSGKRVACLSFDLDHDLLMRDLDEWLTLAPNVLGEKGTAAELEANTQRLRDILNLPHIYPELKGAGITVEDHMKFTQAEVDAVRKLRQSHQQPHWALLIADAGQEPQLIELTLPAKYALNPLALMAVGDDSIVLATQGKSTGGYPEAQLFTVDTATGNLTEFTTYIGAPQTIVLDESESSLLITYLAYDTKTKILADQLSLRSVPLDAPGEATDALLYPAVPDAFAAADDPKTFAVQSAIDHTIYFSREGSTPEPLIELLAPVDGMFLTSDGNHLVYAENGLLFALNVQPGAAQSSDWNDGSSFTQYADEARGFLTKLGYTVPADLSFRWEEREGLGSHEVTGLITYKGEDPNSGALVRYNVEEKRFESVFFPGTPWPHAGLPSGSVDAPEAEQIAARMRTAAGWLSDKAAKYQPGANPLYDGQTGTYMLIFHDGYLVDTPKGQKEAVNGEATIRVHRETGQVIEMNLHTMPQVKSANFKVGDEEIKTSIRNKGRQKYPEDAPIRIDVAAAKLIVARNKQQQWAPAQIEEQTDWRLAWAVDTYIQPENELILTSWVDVETGDVLGELYFMPTSQSQQ